MSRVHDARALFDKYHQLEDRRVVVKLKDGRTLKGVLIGYFKGKEGGKHAFIEKWHLVDESDSFSLGLDLFGSQLGEIISQDDIKEVHFLADDSIITCNI